MMRPSLSVIVPAFNEEGNITTAITSVLSAANSAGIEHEIIVVDDGSTDSTAEQARMWAEARPNIGVIRHQWSFGPGDPRGPINRGLRAAYETGLSAATGEYVTWVPGDGEMAQESIAAIFKAIGSADLVVPYHGTPERRTWLRRLLTWGSTTQLNILLGHRLRYFQGTVVYPTDLARRLPRTEPGFFCMAEMLCHALDAGLTYTEVPLEHQERQNGVSKAVSWSKVWAAQKLILRLWWRLRVRPLWQVFAYASEGWV